MEVYKRRAGVLLPISALPSNYGIGCFSREAYDFVDMLASSGQSVWQILPLCPTSYGDSPYQSPSSFGGNPYFISLDELVGEGLLRCEELPLHHREGSIDYKAIYEERYPLLRLAFDRFSSQAPPEDYCEFVIENSFWLDDHALFMAIKELMGGKPLSELPEKIRRRDAKELALLRVSLCDRIAYHKFLQYKFFTQWKRLRDYANSRGILIIGDIPIYTSADSVDLWVSPELFEVDGDLRPIRVAGCPPDGFSPHGQLWGNPVYNWEAHKREGFEWWKRRLGCALSLYDLVRLDHFRGFDAFYSVEYGKSDGREGIWRKAGGRELFEALFATFDKNRIIAEDLGHLDKGARDLLEFCGFSGMKILQFGFEGEMGDTEHLPYNYGRRSVAYTGTHDNPTLMQWLAGLDGEAFGRVARYLQYYSPDHVNIAYRLMTVAMQSASELCVIPIQDYLFIGEEGRMNTPAATCGNWMWRMKRSDVDEGLIGTIREITEISGRLNVFS